MTERQKTEQCRWTFEATNYASEDFDFGRHSDMARANLIRTGHVLLSSPVFEHAELVGPAGSSGLTVRVTFVADCKPKEVTK